MVCVWWVDFKIIRIPEMPVYFGFLKIIVALAIGLRDEITATPQNPASCWLFPGPGFRNAAVFADVGRNVPYFHRSPVYWACSMPSPF
jgi:hypothetical protein